MSRQWKVGARLAAVTLFAMLSLLSAIAAPAAAQTRQYTSPGGDPDERKGRREALAEAVESARWNTGSLRLDPAFWISDLSWVDAPQSGVDSELTARAGAGLRAYLPVGSRSTFAAYALPEYVWWQERDEENRLNQRFGVGSFTYFNRLSIEVSAERDEDFGYVTGEVYQRVTGRTDLLLADLEIPVFRKISLYAGGFQRSFEALAEEDVLESVFSDLNRDELGFRGGLRYHPTEELWFGGGVGQVETEFADEAADRSNSGDFWYVELSYDRPKLGVELDYQENELEGEIGSEFGVYDGNSAAVRVEWRPRDAYRFRAYGSRALAYSLFTASQTAYVDVIYGLGASLDLGWRLTLDLYFETGSQDYEAELGGDGQSADTEGYGASLSIELGRNFDLRVGYRSREISAVVGRPGRESEEILAGLNFGLGGGSASWY